MPKAFITGGTKRIGRYIADKFIENNYNIILHDHSDTSHRDEIIQAYPEKKNHISFINADLTDSSDIQSLCNKMLEEHHIPDVFIHTASIFAKDKFDDFTHENWHKHFNIHTLAPLQILQFFAKYRQNKQKLSMIFLIDQRVTYPNPDFFSYTASKMLCADLVKTLAMSLAPHICVNGISPGPTLRNIRQSQEDFDLQAELTPLQHAVSPQEIAEACMFICNTPSMTGQIITIDSGQSIDWRTEAYQTVKE